MIKKVVLIVYLISSSILSQSQNLGNYQITDYLINAVHPHGCSSNYVIGPPDNKTWVNLSNTSNSDSMTGNFRNSITNFNRTLLLETSFNTSNYNVSLLLSTGQYSLVHEISTADWIQISDTTWDCLYTLCQTGIQPQPFARFILPLDFSINFGLSTLDTVTGIKIVFLTSNGWPDLAGVYIAKSLSDTSGAVQGLTISNVNLTDFYPNPIKDLLCFKKDFTALAIENSEGRQVYMTEDKKLKGCIDVSFLSSGLYWVEATNRNGTYRTKFIKE